MAITHVATVRSAIATDIKNRTDAGTTNPNGKLIIMAAGDVEVATLNFGNPAFGAEAGGTITANAITRDETPTGGAAVAFKVVDRDDGEVYRGSVGTSGSDLNIPSGTTVANDQPFEVSSFAYTAPV